MSLLNERFEILEEIGRGGQAVTYRAKDHETGEVVALKELDFRRVEDWKAQELFEREGQTLRSLEHPAIPRYVDAFAVEDDTQVKLFLAQEFIDGPTLQDELDAGRRWTEADARSDALLLLEALAYLHGLSPPVVHRDIKPSNIIRRGDGGLALVDFGAVQNIVPKTVGGSTIVGTPGYMPIEQVMGRAVAGSDIYALGATLIHLLTRTNPSDLPVDRNRLMFRQRTSLSDEFAAVLDDMTHPSIEDRIDSADRARERLDGRKVVVSSEFPVMHFPPWATVAQQDDGVTFVGFNTFGLEGNQQHITLRDSGAELVLATRTEHDPELTNPAAVAVVALLLAVLVIFLPVVGSVVALGAMFAALARVREARRKQSTSQTICELQLEDDTYTLQAETGRRRGRTKSIREFDVDRDTLVLVESDGSRVPMFAMAFEDRFRWEWLVPHLNRRLGELRGEVVLDHGEREEFWKEEPVDAAKKS